MGRWFTLLFSIFSGLVLIGILGYSFYRLDDARSAARDEAEETFSVLIGRIESRLLEAEPELLSERVREAASPFVNQPQESPVIRALAVFSERAGVEYIWAAEERYLSEARRVDGRIQLPKLSVNPVTDVSVRRPLRGPGTRVVVEGVYDILPRRALLVVLRDAAIGTGALGLFVVLVAALGALLPFSTSRATTPPKPKRKQVSKPENRTGGKEQEPSGRPDDPHISMRSGVTLQSHLQKRLTLELERAAFNDQDLTLIIVRLPGFAPGSSRYRWFARLMLEAFKFEDLVFEYGQDAFAAVLTNTGLDQAIRATEEFQRKNAAALARERVEPLYGMSSRNGRLIEGPLLLTEANAAVERARKTPGRVVGFRPDPQRYRQHIASRPPQRA